MIYSVDTATPFEQLGPEMYYPSLHFNSVDVSYSIPPRLEAKYSTVFIIMYLNWSTIDFRRRSTPLAPALRVRLSEVSVARELTVSLQCLFQVLTLTEAKKIET